MSQHELRQSDEGLAEISRLLFWKQLSTQPDVKPDTSLLGQKVLIFAEFTSGPYLVGTVISNPSKFCRGFRILVPDQLEIRTVFQYKVSFGELFERKEWVVSHNMMRFPPTGVAPSAGDRVLAEWKPGIWYGGTVTGAGSQAGRWLVEYDDGDISDGLSADQIIIFPDRRMPIAQPFLSEQPNEILYESVDADFEEDM